MNNFREVNDDILKEWLEFREETAFCEMSPQDKKYCIYFEEIVEKILKNVPKQNKKYVQDFVIRFLFVGSRILLHHFLHPNITVFDLWFATLGDKYP